MIDKNYAETDEILYGYLNNPRAKNAAYVSLNHRMPSLIINVISYDIILTDIVS